MIFFIIVLARTMEDHIINDLATDDQTDDDKVQLFPDEIVAMIAMCGWRAYNKIRIVNRTLHAILVVSRDRDTFAATIEGAFRILKPLIREYYRLTMVRGEDVLIFKGGRLVKKIVYTIPKGYGHQLWELSKITRISYDDKYTREEDISFAYGVVLQSSRFQYLDARNTMLGNYNINLTNPMRPQNRGHDPFYLYH